MPLKIETISGIHLGVPYSFDASNKRNKGRKGIVYMTDREFAAHKLDQENNAKKQIEATQQEQQDEQDRIAARNRVKAKLNLTDAELDDLRKVLR